MNLNHDECDERLARGDILVGCDPIRAYLVFLGMPPTANPYYLKRSGWPIGSTSGGGAAGGKLMASKRRLARHAENLARGHAHTDDYDLK
jgi:hypothetical protein